MLRLLVPALRRLRSIKAKVKEARARWDAWDSDRKSSTIFRLILGVGTSCFLTAYFSGEPWAIAATGIAAAIAVLLDGLGLVTYTNQKNHRPYAWPFVIVVALGSLQVILQVQASIREAEAAKAALADKQDEIIREQENLRRTLTEIRRNNLVLRPDDWRLRLSFFLKPSFELPDYRSVGRVRAYLVSDAGVRYKVDFMQVDPYVTRIGGGRGLPKSNYLVFTASKGRFDHAHEISYLDEYKEIQVELPPDVIDGAIQLHCTFDTEATIKKVVKRYIPFGRSTPKAYDPPTSTISIPLKRAED